MMLIVNGFDAITSLACKLQILPSVQFGHQAKLRLSPLLDQKKSIMGELHCNIMLLQKNIGLHFEN
jgi:hypothetical protein